MGEKEEKKKKENFLQFLVKKRLRRRLQNYIHSFVSFTDEGKVDKNENTFQGCATQSGFKLRTSE